MLLHFAHEAGEMAADTRDQLLALGQDAIPVQTLVITQHSGHIEGLRVLTDPKGLVERRFDGKTGTTVLIRPDQHVAARWRRFDGAAVRAAVARATCQTAVAPAANKEPQHAPANRTNPF